MRPYAHVFICPCVHMPMRPYAHVSMCPYAHVSIRPYAHVSICRPVAGFSRMRPYRALATASKEELKSMLHTDLKVCRVKAHDCVHDCVTHTGVC